MSEADQIKEEVGWLKLIFAALIAIEVSLIGWLAQNYTAAGCHYWPGDGVGESDSFSSYKRVDAPGRTSNVPEGGLT